MLVQTHPILREAPPPVRSPAHGAGGAAPAGQLERLERRHALQVEAVRAAQPRDACRQAHTVTEEDNYAGHLRL